MARDAMHTERLNALGWIVIRIWEHQVKRLPDECAAMIAAAVMGSVHAGRPEV
jgi:very-short-patch-repair endonuclease